MDADGLKDTHFLLCWNDPDGICEVNKKGNYDICLCGCTIFNFQCGVKVGDNHNGYMGFRDTSNKTLLRDDGAINIVVENWKNPLN